MNFNLNIRADWNKFHEPKDKTKWVDGKPSYDIYNSVQERDMIYAEPKD